MHKRILLIGNIPPPFGGVPAHINYLAPYLARQGWDVHILSSGYPKGIHKVHGCTVYKPTAFEKLGSFIPPKLKAGELLRFAGMAFDSPKRFLGFANFANYIKKIVKEKGIEIVSAYHMYAAFAAAPACEEYSVPLVTTVFGELFSDNGFYRTHIKEVERICRLSRKMLSCSRHCARSFSSLNLPVEGEAVYYGIDVDRFNPKNDPMVIRSRLGMSEQDKVVLYVGRMNRSLGLHVLLEAIPLALEKNKDIKFIIAGAQGPFTPAAIELMNRYPENIKVCPNVSFQDLPFYYAAATIAVAPSINERACLGLAIAEAMATEKAAIGCDVGGTGEVVVNGESGVLIPPENPGALADSIVKLIGDEAVIARLGKNGRGRVLELFDKDKVNARMERIFKEVIEN